MHDANRFAALLAVLAVFACAPEAPPPADAPSDAVAFESPLAALDSRLGDELGVPVRAEPVVVREQDGWAFVIAQPRAPDGAAIDWAETTLAEDAAEGMLDGDGRTYALLQRRDGAWSVVDFAVGPTDVAWEPWARTYGAPAELIAAATAAQ